MALDFDLKLIMPEDNAGIFCRSALEATRYLIKHQQPNLARKLTLVMDQPPLPLNEQYTDTVYEQMFFVDLSPTDIWQITEQLMSAAHSENNHRTPGLVMLAKTLYQDWMALANAKIEVKDPQSR